MKKLLIMLSLCLLLTVGLCACNDTPPPDDDLDDDPPAAETVDIIVDGESVYRLIRSDRYMSSDEMVAATTALRGAIIEATSCQIGIKTDYEDKDDNLNIPEILVGDTNRAADELIPADLKDNEFVIIFKDNKLLIAGKDGYSTKKAVEYFVATYLGYDKATGEYAKTNLSVPKDLNYRGQFEYPATVYLINKDINSLPGASGTEAHNDVVRLIVSLQGRLNKNAKENNFYIYYNHDSTDDFWLEYISGEGKMLAGSRVKQINSWSDFWETFGSYIIDAGMVAWDPDVPSTANVAATICSVDGHFPVRYSSEKSSVYAWLAANGVTTKVNLCDMFDGVAGTTIADTGILSSGSSKCDAYLWALEKYGDRCNSEMLAYTLDAASCVKGNPIFENAKNTDPSWNQIYNHDYLIYNECFFFDLTCYADEVPCDDPTQPLGTDAATLRTILEFFAEKNNGKMGKLMGFPPWYVKYTKDSNTGSLAATTLEWKFVDYISAYNFIKEADAAHPSWMTNGSVYTQYTPTVKYENSEAELDVDYDENVHYFTMYMGDYDSSAWFKQHIPGFFADSRLGEYPLMWGFNPNLGDRVPMVFDFVYENMTENDFIAAGDSGAGYITPALIPDLSTWVDYNEPYMGKYDMDIVGFIINTTHKMTSREFAAYAEIAPIGSFHNDSSKKLVIWENNTVYMHLMNGIGDPTDGKVAERMYGYAASTEYPFSAYRTICKSPSEIYRAIEEFIEYANAQNDGYTYQCVDPYTLFDLVLQSGCGKRMGN